MPTKQSSFATLVCAILAVAALVQPAWAGNATMMREAAAATSKETATHPL